MRWSTTRHCANPTRCARISRPEYRQLRSDKGSFLDLVYDSDAAAEVTLQPLKRFPQLDAAILRQVLFDGRAHIRGSDCLVAREIFREIVVVHGDQYFAG